MIDKILYGKDDTKGIVDVHLDGEDIIEYRMQDGFIKKSRQPFHPFFFLSDINLIKGFDESQFQWTKLKGQNHFKYLCAFRSYSMYNNAKYYIKAKNRNAIYYPKTPEAQYLMQTGKTLFKGLAMDDVHRLQFDIETYSPKGFPTKKQDPIIIISLSDNTGWETILYTGKKVIEDGVHCSTEKELLEQFVNAIQIKDPDILEGYNCYKFDIPYIEHRCEVNNVPFNIGRDGSAPVSWNTKVRFAERNIDYPRYKINGRHIIDVYFNVLADDVYRRDMESHTLKYAAKYYGYATDDREYVEGKDIWKVWDEDPERLLRYALDDVRETKAISEHLTGSTFYLTQMLPMRYGDIAVAGNGTKIESLFVREYLRRRQSIPRSEEGRMTTGGLTKVFKVGLFEPVLYADVESLYPSIMLNYNIQPERDNLKLFPYMLKNLTDLRFKVKDQMKKEKNERKKSELDSMQNSYKILINSFFGVLGFSYFLWNDFSEADRVTQTGQKLLRQIVDVIEEKNGTVIEMDTDGVLFVPPESVYVGSDSTQTPEGMVWDETFVKSITKEMPEGIRIGFDGRYKRMFSYASKNYALLDFKGKIKIKGGAFKNRKEERFGRQYSKDLLKAILHNDIDAIHDTYMKYRNKILRRDWSIEDFSKSITLNESLKEYEDKLENTGRTPDPHYEVAKNLKNKVDKGDRITYYITGNKKNVTAYKNAEHADLWKKGKENLPYYLGKLDDFSTKYKPFFDEFDYRMLFSPDDMFGFTSEGIKIKQLDA